MSLRTCFIRNQEKEFMKQKGTEFTSIDQQERKRLIQIYQENLKRMKQEYGEMIINDPEVYQRFIIFCKQLGIDLSETEDDIHSFQSLQSFDSIEFFSNQSDETNKKKEKKSINENELLKEIIDECNHLQMNNCGIIELSLFYNLLQKRLNEYELSENDIEKSIEIGKIFGNTLQLITIGNKKYIFHLPIELNDDHKLFLQLFDQKEYVLENELIQMNWSQDKIKEIIVCFLFFFSCFEYVKSLFIVFIKQILIILNY